MHITFIPKTFLFPALKRNQTLLLRHFLIVHINVSVCVCVCCVCICACNCVWHRLLILCRPFFCQPEWNGRMAYRLKGIHLEMCMYMNCLSLLFYISSKYRRVFPNSQFFIFLYLYLFDTHIHKPIQFNSFGYYFLSLNIIYF
jgi:hypothetical protein